MASKKLRIDAGDCVLVGSPRHTMPTDWFLARVLWADGEDVLTEHQTPSGPMQRQLLSIDSVRAVGDGYALLAFRREATKACDEQRAHVHEAERALHAARAGVWQRLDEINASTPRRVEHAPQAAE